MKKLFKGSTENKLNAFNLEEELTDKSTLPIIKRGLKIWILQ